MKVHIGKKIEEVYNERGMKLSAFSKRIGTVRQNIYKIFARESINTDLLKRISEALEYNFFVYYLENEDMKILKDDKAVYGKISLRQHEKKMEETQKEIDRLKREIEIRDKMISLLEEKLKGR